MADSKITALTSISTSTDPANDPLVIVDVSDTSMAASGTAKKVTLNQLLGASGTATLASATITGDLTVDTNVLKVDTLNNRVGVLTATPSYPLHVNGTDATNVLFNGATKGVRFVASASKYSITGVDNTGAATFQPLAIGGASLEFQIGSTTHFSIDASGNATWSNVGGVAGTAMTLNATGLGVGVSPSYKLDASATTNLLRLTSASGNDCNIVLTQSGVGNWMLYNAATNGQLRFQFGGNDRMIVDTSGNVGIGVTPSAWNTLTPVQVKNAAFSGYLNNAYVTSNSYYNANHKYIASDFAAMYVQTSGQHQWYNAPSGTAGNAITFTQAMTLDASGNLLVGTTNSVVWNTTNQGCVIGPNAIQASRSGDTVLLLNRIGSNGKIAVFARQGLEVGDISVTTTGTTFNSTSDYRLKEDVQPLVGGLARVSALKPSIYKWKSNGSSGEGFLAHELAEVVPAAVSGEKDAVNEDGSIKAQSIDMSRVVPILVAAIQELAARVQTLETR